MSYFFCGYKNDGDIKKEFENLFQKILPEKLLTNPIKLSGESSCFVGYGNNKIIPDIVITNKKSGSWLIIAGTPLIQFKDEHEKLGFLDEFLNNPINSLQKRIDGNFSLFSYDAKTDRIIVATDINNTTPVFYSKTAQGIIISSNELVLAKYLKAEIDPLGFSHSIHLGIPWGEYTRFKNIYKMLPCQLLIINNKKEIHKDQYWTPQNETIWKGSLDQNIEKWNSILKDSILKYYNCSGGKPVVSDFTAGEDSRLLVAQCHAAGIPFKAQVTGFEDELDIKIAKHAAKIAGFDLIEIRRKRITKNQLLDNVFNVMMYNEGYQEFFKSCTEFASIPINPIDDYKTVKYCGAPGGEAYRGSYYLRGKVIFPSMKTKLDRKFFTKMKFLLDFHPGLMQLSDKKILDSIDDLVINSLKNVNDYPVGIQIDHLLREFQTCYLGLRYRNPLYLPLATYNITRSIYNLSPRHKRGGRLTKACTEILFPELAFVKNQNGVPTIRKSFLRLPYFIPEYIAPIKKIYNGALGRLFKWKQAKGWYSGRDYNIPIFTALFNNSPYCDWFLSSKQMITGHLYNPDIIDPILSKAKAGFCKYIPLLGRIINQELACRWIYNR